MKSKIPDTDELICGLAAGDVSACDQLLNRHRARLAKAIALRLDRRLAARFDASDIVQETLAEAALRLPDYVREKPLPFYPWLRRLAAQKMTDIHRRHVLTERRSVRREQLDEPHLPNRSAIQLIERLIHRGGTASHHLLRKETQERVRKALADLKPAERDVLILRNLEQLSTKDTAAVLGIAVEASRSRHRRALEKLADALGDLFSGALE